jgi:hypothetical protein
VSQKNENLKSLYLCNREIRQLIIEFNLNNKLLAEELGVTDQHISNVLNNEGSYNNFRATIVLFFMQKRKKGLNFYTHIQSLK